MSNGEYLEVQPSRWCPVCYRQMSVESTSEGTDPRSGLALTTIKWCCEACASGATDDAAFDPHEITKAYDVESGSELSRSEVELALRGRILSVDSDPLAEEFPLRREGYLYDVKIRVSTGSGEHTYYWLAA
jgi:hypothetical protein